MLYPLWARWVSDDCQTICDIFRHHRPSSDNDPFANDNPRQHHGPCTDEGVCADDDVSGKAGARTDMDTVANAAVMIDGGRSIDDHATAESRMRTHCRLSQHLATRAYLCIISDERRFVYHREDNEAQLLEFPK